MTKLESARPHEQAIAAQGNCWFGFVPGDALIGFGGASSSNLVCRLWREGVFCLLNVHLFSSASFAHERVPSTFVGDFDCRGGHGNNLNNHDNRQNRSRGLYFWILLIQG